MADEYGEERAQRVRVGLTGLASVFLLVLLFAAFFGLTTDRNVDEPPQGPQSGANAATAQPEPAAEEPREPLAELGVAPGYVPEAEINGAAAEVPTDR